MKKLTLILTLGLMLGLAVPLAAPADTALAAPFAALTYTETCSPPPPTSTPPGPVSGGTQWVANGTPVDTSCWAPFNAEVTQSTTCGWMPENAWEFHYGGNINQSITIPSSYTASNYIFHYELDFLHPNDASWWDQFTMRVYDQTTGTELASEYLNGTGPSFYCAQHNFPWNANLAGHTLVISFQGQGVSLDAHVRVRNIALFSSY